MFDKRLSYLPVRERRGSRARCILLTDGERERVAEKLTRIVEPYAVVEPSRIWMPNGFSSPGEAKLGEVNDFLSLPQREIVTRWWLARQDHANTPNWDVAATATIDGQDGIILVEAKAHNNEIKSDGKQVGNPANHARIQLAINEANQGLNLVMPGWNLSTQAAYQLANRFAWSWKLTTLRIPVILVYLGFLRADEMDDQGRAFQKSDTWETIVRSHSHGIVPSRAWTEKIDLDGIPLRALIRSEFISLKPTL